MTVPQAPVINATQLKYLRKERQHSGLFIAFPQAHIIFQAQVNETFATADMIYEITYDNVTYGAFGDVVVGMECWVGSAPGLYDLGQCRIRKVADATKLYIGETSEIVWTDDLYLTVVDEYGLWARPIYVVDENTSYMDRDVAYVDQNKYMGPVPVMGPDIVLDYLGILGGANTIATTGFDDTPSWCPDGDTIASHLWTCVGATITGPTTSNPTFTFDAPGTYIVADTITTTIGGKSTTGRRRVVVLDTTSPAASQFTLTSAPTGNFQNGGFSFRVEMRDPTELTNLRPRAPVILFTRDFYESILSVTYSTISFNASTYNILDSGNNFGSFKAGMVVRVTGSIHNDGLYTVLSATSANIHVSEKLVNEAVGASITVEETGGMTNISLGPVAGRENVLCTGWIAEEDLEINPTGGWATFTVQGPQYWLGQVNTFPNGVENVNLADPTDWLHIQNLTVDKAVWLFLYWQSTACFVMDIYLTGDIKLAERFQVPFGSIFDKVKAIATAAIIAVPCCDQFGRMFVQVDGLYDITGTVFNDVMDLGSSDRYDVQLQYRPVPQTSQVDLSGVSYDGTTGTALRSLAPGHVNKRYGRPEVADKLLLADQANANALSIRVLAQRINPYPNIVLDIWQNNRFLGVCPQQRFRVTMSQYDVPKNLGLMATNVFYFYPREVTLTWSETSHSISVHLTGETEYWPQALDIQSVTGTIPAAPPADPTAPPITFPPTPPINWPYIPPPPSNAIALHTHYALPGQAIVQASQYDVVWTVPPVWIYPNAGLWPVSSSGVGAPGTGLYIVSISMKVNVAQLKYVNLTIGGSQVADNEFYVESTDQDVVLTISSPILISDGQIISARVGTTGILTCHLYDAWMKILKLGS